MPRRRPQKRKQNGLVKIGRFSLNFNTILTAAGVMLMTYAVHWLANVDKVVRQMQKEQMRVRAEYVPPVNPNPSPTP